MNVRVSPRSLAPGIFRGSRLHLERLEDRLVLSAATVAPDYDSVSEFWFGAPGPHSASSLSAVSSETAAPLATTQWIVRLTAAAAAQAGSVSGSAGVLGDLGASYRVVAGLGLPGQILLETWNSEPDVVRHALQSHAAVAYAGLNATISGAAPVPANDVSYTQGRQFGLNLSSASGIGNPAVVDADIDAPEAWEVTTGSSSVVVAVLDSGVDYNHEDLAGNIWTDPVGGGHGYDFFSNDANPMDEHGHGTHVAGIIGARGNNTTGVTGVNWNVSLLPVRVLGPNNVGTVAQAICGIHYVTMLAERPDQPVNVRVINASWSVAAPFVEQSVKAALAAAIKEAGDADILFVAAAGNGDILNNGVDLNNASFLPANIERDQAVTLDNLVVVGASDPFDRLTYFSNYGAGIVDLTAPGDDILSTLPQNNYGYRDGTSMAAPFVSGAAALVVANQAASGVKLSPVEIKEALLSTVDLLATPDDRGRIATSGRLNLNQAVRYTAFAPRVSVHASDDITAPKTEPHSIKLRYAGKTAINTSTLGVDDIVVRNAATGATLAVLPPTHALVGGDPKVVEVTYQLTGPGDGAWNVPDNGVYQIEVVAGSVSDQTQATEAKVFTGVDGFTVNIQQGVIHVTSTADSLTGPTLRAAVITANQTPGSVILLSPGTYTLSRVGVGEDAALTGDLDITGQVTIASNGSGPVIINATGLLDRLFDVRPGATLTLNGVTITGGNGSGVGGGIRNAGTLTVENCTIVDNASGGDGGGIYNAGAMTVTSSTIEDNQSTGDGGGIWSQGTATVRTSTVSENSARSGAGFFNSFNGTATFDSSTISLNEASGPRAGTLDSSFGIGGKAIVDTGFANEEIAAMALQTDGKIIVVGAIINGGNNDFVLMRLNSDGSLDTTFDGDGRVTTDFGATDDAARDVAIQADGKIVVVGETSTGSGDFAIARYHPNGALDTSFSGDGKLTTPVGSGADIARSVAIQQDGKIVAAGSSFSGTNDFAVVRYTVNGVLDTSFSGDGKAFAEIAATGAQDNGYSVAIQSDGKIVLAGESNFDFALARFTSNGNLDTSFSGDGKLSTNIGAGDNALSLAIQSNGALVVAGFTNVGGTPSLALARYLPNGTFDPTFNNGTPRTDSFASPSLFGGDGLALQADGKIVAAASSVNFAVVARYNVDGSLDASFNDAGKVSTEFGDVDDFIDVRPVAVQPDGQIIVAGVNFNGSVADVVLARYVGSSANGGGVYNAGTLNSTNVTISGNEAANQGGGVYNAAGATLVSSNSTVTANNSFDEVGASLDSTFGVGGVVTTPMTGGVDIGLALAVQPDGKTIVAGYGLNGNYDFAVARHNRDGSLDSTFDGDGKAFVDIFGSTDSIESIVLQPDGKIIVAGQTHLGGNDWDFAVARLNPNGSLDSTFSGDGKLSTSFGLLNDQSHDMLLQPDGKIIVVGKVETATGNDVAIARYLSNGTLDSSFDGDGKLVFAFNPSVSDVANGVALQSDGKIIVVGHSGADAAVARLNSNGSFDATFDGDGKLMTDFGTAGDIAYDVKLLLDGRFVVVGRTASDLAVARYNANGSLDSSFSGDGRQISDLGRTDIAYSVALQPNGKIVLAGHSATGPLSEGVIVRYLVDGSLDPNFGIAGKITVPNATFDEVALGDGTIVAAGQTSSDDFIAVRVAFAPEGAGIHNVTGGSANLTNTIVAGNGQTTLASDVVGAFISGGGNLIGNVGPASGLNHGANGDKVGSSATPIDPQLGPLADNGGPTKTHLPADTSPAIDAGLTAGAPTLDQRSVIRKDTSGTAIVDGNNDGTPGVDIGAVERYSSSISGKKYHDRNSNGLQDSGDEPLPGWTIYVDLDLDGRHDANEPFDVTDAAGLYTISGMAPGTYRVAEVAQQGWERTYLGTTVSQEFLDGVVDGLAGAAAIATAAGNRFVFGAGAGEAEIARFERSFVTSQLNFLGVTTTTNTSPTAGNPNVLAGVSRMVVGTTAAGMHLYALSPNGSIAVFLVNQSTGELTPSDVIREGDNRGGLVEHLTGATGLAISPDGLRLYVSNSSANSVGGGTILVFERVGTQLFRRRELSNGPSVFGAGGSAVVVSPDGAHVYVGGATSDGSDTLATFNRVAGNPFLNYATAAPVLRNNQNDLAGNLVRGLNGVNSLAVSADGRFVYASARDDDAVTVFSRNLVSGALTFVQTLVDGDVDYLGSAVSGVVDASAVTLSADGERLYVAGKKDVGLPGDPFFVGTLAVFSRDAASGRLALLEVLEDATPDPQGAPIENLEQTTALLAPDSRYLYVASGAGEDALTVFNRDRQGRDVQTLLVGQDLTGINFSNRALPGAIFGLVYENKNPAPGPDVDDPRLSGWEVFVDVNGNGQWDDSLPQLGGASEPITETDATGVYALENLAANATYTVRVIPRVGWEVVVPAADSYQVAIAPGEVELQLDFGVALTNFGSGLGSFTGIVFQDTDGDGEQDPLELGIPNLRVFLDLDDDGVLDLTEPFVTTSNGTFGAAGGYTFANAPEATFVIRIDPVSLAQGGHQVLSPIGNALSQQTYSLGSSINPTQTVAADFDVDGDTDVAVLTLDGVVTVFRNNGSGQFTSTLLLPNSFGATSIAVGDFNGDGRPDIALASSTVSRVAIAMNQPVPAGQLAFVPYNTSLATSLANWDLVAADFNGDNKADLALAQRATFATTPSQVLIFQSMTTSLTPSFALIQTVGVGRQPRSLKALDVDGDLDLDLALVNQFDRSLQVLRKGANFAAQSAITLPTASTVDAPFSLAAGHFNGDTKLDFVVGNSHSSLLSLVVSQDNAIYGVGGYTLFSNQPLDARGLPRDVAAADIDGDGDRDIIVGTVNPAGVSVFRNTGDAQTPEFAPAEVRGVGVAQTNDFPGVKSLVVADLANNGGLPDIAAVTGKIDAGSLVVFANSTITGAHRVAATTAELPGLNFALSAAAAATGDFDSDGNADGGDFLAWQRGFGRTTGATRAQGDANGDGKVDAADYTAWRRAFAEPAAQEAAFAQSQFAALQSAAYSSVAAQLGASASDLTSAAYWQSGGSAEAESDSAEAAIHEQAFAGLYSDSAAPRVLRDSRAADDFDHIEDGIVDQLLEQDVTSIGDDDEIDGTLQSPLPAML